MTRAAAKSAGRSAAARRLLHPAFSLTVDVDRALLYAVFAGPEPDVFFGGERAAADPLREFRRRARRAHGRRRWNFQTVHHDVWDYDLLAPPVLLDVTIDGERVPVLAQPGRAGYLYVLDRVTGEPVFDIVETPMPPPTCRASARRRRSRFRSKPPRARARELHSRRSRDGRRHHGRARGVLPRAARSQRRLAELAGRSRRIAIVRRARASLDDRVSRARSAARAGAASRPIPRLGFVFVNTSSEGGIGWLEPSTADATSAQTGEGARTRAPAVSAHERCRRAVGALLVERRRRRLRRQRAERRIAVAWPCQKPPWGELMAVNVATGDVVWRVPLGLTEQLPESRRRTGRLNLGGPIVTAARARLHRREQRSTVPRVRLADGRGAMGHGAAAVRARRADHVSRRPTGANTSRSSRPGGSR